MQETMNNYNDKFIFLYMQIVAWSLINYTEHI